MDLRVGQVSVDAPRLTVVTPARSDVTLSAVTMAVQYVGTGINLATYTPIDVQGNTTLLFQLDPQVFNQPIGFYLGVLLFNGEPFAQLTFQYTTLVSIAQPLQLSTTGPYIVPPGYACPNWSGTGISGPGTFVGLKDVPNSYSGAAGHIVLVNATETGLAFSASDVGLGTVTSVDTGAGLIGGPIIGAGSISLDSASIASLALANTSLQGVVAGTGVTVDNTNPHAPVVSATSSSSGTVTSVSVGTANGVSGSVATPTTTPAITLALGDITPTSVAASGAVSGSNLSGTNTGDQTITLTGDVTGTGAGSFAATLATSGVTAGMYGDATHVSQVVVDAKGRVTSAAAVAIAAGGSGTVTSVALALPADYTVTGSPITGAGTLTATWASQTAKFFLAAPNASAGAPTYRAIVASDVPTLNQSTTGSAATLTTPRTIAGVSFNGSADIAIPFSGLTSRPTTVAGYGITDALSNPMTAVGDMIVGGTAGAPTRVAIGTVNYVWTSNGTTGSWQASAGGGVTLANTSAWTKNQYVAPTTLTYAATVTPDAPTSNNFQLTLTGACTLANPTNLQTGMVLNFCVDQDATGGRVLTLGSLFKWPGGTVPTWTTTASAKNFFSAYYDGSILRCSGGAGYA